VDASCRSIALLCHNRAFVSCTCVPACVRAKYILPVCMCVRAFVRVVSIAQHEAAKRQRQEMSDEELARRLHAEESAGGQVRGPQRAGGGGRATHGGGGGGDGDDKKKCVIM
jgi:hypothetical protein